MRFRSVLKSVLKVFTICVSLLLIVASIYGNTTLLDFTFLDLTGLIIPYLIPLNFLMLVYFVLKRNRLAYLILLSLSLWYVLLGPFYKIYISDESRTESNIKILTFNVHNFNGDYRIPHDEITPRIIDFINNQDADIVCFQEYNRSKISTEDFKGYPYQYIYSYNTSLQQYSPLAIFSKYAIIASGSLGFNGTANNAVYADIVKNKDTLRVYNVHLQSLQIRPGSIKRENPLRIYRRLGKTFDKQRLQANQVMQHSHQAPYPNIICGDLNNTQYSRIYQKISSNMKDTFLEEGIGFGRTLKFKFLPFRLDYIFADPAFEILSHKNYDVVLSDHFPVMASMKLKTN